jgi:hypothetical protein
MLHVANSPMPVWLTAYRPQPSQRRGGCFLFGRRDNRHLRRDDSGKRSELVLSQRLMPTSWWSGPIPGRLYLDGWLVPKRGALEEAILRLLTQLVDNLQQGSAEKMEQATEIKTVIEFVQSPEYSATRRTDRAQH